MASALSLFSLLSLLSLLCLPSTPFTAPDNCKEKILSLLLSTQSGHPHADAKHDDGPIIFTITTHKHKPADITFVYTHAPTHENAVTTRAGLYKSIFEVVANRTRLPFESLTFLVNPSDGCCRPFPLTHSRTVTSLPASFAYSNFSSSSSSPASPSSSSSSLSSSSSTFPILSHCIIKQPPDMCGHVGLIPSYSTMSLTTFLTRHADVDEKLSRIPWMKRIDRVIWRGSPTGRGPVPKRPRVVNLLPFVGSADVDACFPIFNSVGGNATRAIEDLQPFGVTCPGDKMKFSDFARYRYVLDMDGNSWSDRFIHLFNLGSTIFKQESDYADFATQIARPFVHYIPIKDDLSDLMSAVAHCRRAPLFCAKVAENGAELAKTKLGMDARVSAWRERIVEYYEICGK